jgi:hypothetical protein
MILKKKLLMLFSSVVLITTTVHSDIVINKNLSLTGFIDMSYVAADEDTVGTTTTMSLDQFEVDFLFNFENGFSAQVDLEAETSQVDGDKNADVEQAFIKYDFGSGFSTMAGRFLSFSGFETEEPTGLFQFSKTGYAPTFYGYYQDGVHVQYSHDFFDIGLSIVDEVYDSGTGSGEDVGYEFMVALKPVEGLTLKGFYMTDKGNDITGTGEDEVKLDFWVMYSIADFTFAAEYVTADDIGGINNKEADGMLLMAHYGYDRYGITLRYSAYEIEDSTGKTTDNSAITIAPSYAANDYLSFILEYRMDDNSLATVNDVNTIAFEALVVF